MNKNILLPLVGLVFSAAPAFADVGVSATVVEQVVQAANGSNVQIEYGSSFINNAQTVTANDPILYFLNTPANQLQSSQTILHGRAIYTVPIAAAKLDQSFFENLPLIQKLIGSSSTLTLQSQSPFTFEASVSAVVLSVTSVQVLHIYEQAELASNPTLSFYVSEINRRPIAPTRVIVQQGSNFSSNLQSDFGVTLLYDDGNGKTDIEAISGALINSIPFFISQGLISSTTQSDAVSYINNLAALKL